MARLDSIPNRPDLATLTPTLRNKLGRCSEVSLMQMTIVLLAQIVIFLIVRASGSLAISDDDYARVVIAQNFSSEPSLDPSGTSWLPLPFVITGSMMTLIGPTLAAARTTALLLSCFATIALYGSARLLGLSSRFVVPSVLLAISLPYAAKLSVATVPEYSTAAALVFAVSTLPLRPQGAQLHPHANLRLAGAISMFFACASRYESWPAACAFVAWSTLDLYRAHRLVTPGTAANQQLILSVSIICAALFPISWMIHGFVNHNNPLFFVKRVVDYKDALGDDLPSFVQLLGMYPKGLFSHAPELMCGLALAGLLIIVKRPHFPKTSQTVLRRLLRPWSVLLVLFLALNLGAARGGAPTHHPERALLSLWMLAALSIFVLASEPSDKSYKKLLTALLLGIGVGFSIRLMLPISNEWRFTRDSEETMGRYIQQSISQNAEIAVLPPDYGYFALMAAASHPQRFIIFDQHDPRYPKEQLASRAELETWLKKGGCLFVTGRDAYQGTASMLRQAGELTLWRSGNCTFPK